MKYFVMLVMLALSACTVVTKESAVTKAPVVTRLPQQTVTVTRGEVVQLTVPKIGSIVPARLVCADQTVVLQAIDDRFEGYYAASYFAPLTEQQCVVVDTNGIEYPVVTIKISDKEYPREQLQVAKRRVRLSQADQARVDQEQAMLNTLYGRASPQAFFEQPFRRPLYSKITSDYGSQRVFNNDLKTPHLGIDMRAPLGTPVPVANRGTVVFAGELFYTGNTVIVDHGLGIFTNYGHLSRLAVIAGETVAQGQVIGRSGNTGRTTAPHLHWGVRVHGHYINGFSLIRATGG